MHWKSKSQGGKMANKPMFRNLVVTALLLLFANGAQGHLTYIGYSGAPGSRGQCAYQCHSQHDFTPTVTVTGFPTTYAPGQQYTIGVAHSGGSSIGQFNASVRVGTGSTNAGTLAGGTGTSTYTHTQETNGIHFTSSNQNSGTFLWTAPASGTGDVRLYWAGLQGNLTTGSDTLVVLVSHEGAGDNRPIISSIPPQTVPENGHLSIRVSANDPDGDPITLTAQQLPANASFHDSTGGVGGFIFDPNFSQSGPYQVRIIALANSLADTEIVNITVTNVDRAPVLIPVIAQSIPEGGHLALRITATDPDGEAIALLAQQLPANAAFHDSSGGIGGLRFDPDYSQAGAYQVRIIASSNSLADTELININVTNTDRIPIISPISPQSIPAGGHLAVRISSIDPDGDPITLTALGLPVHGNFTDSTGGIGGLIFDPDSSQIGTFPISIIAQANSLADTIFFNIMVTPPVGGCSYVVGDANNSNSFTGLDVTYSVRYFKGGPHPIYSCECSPGNTWYVSGDVNGSCSFSGLDVTYMVRYFKGGAAPIPCPSCPPIGLLAPAP
jgi:hypothetical protein